MENELSRVVDALPGVVWTALPDGYIDFLNHRWCDYTGLSADESNGRGWQTAIAPEDLTGLLERWRSILASGEPGEMEARLRRIDGEYRWSVIRARPLADASGRILKWCGMISDIEDERRTGEALRASVRAARLIVDTIPGLVATMTATGGVELVNSQILEYFGRSLEELKRWAFSDAVHPGDRPGAVAAWTHAVETGEPYDIEHRVRRADGVYRWFRVRGLPLREPDGTIGRWYVLLSDIEDAKRADALLAGEKRFLEMVAAGSSMSAILEDLCRLVEGTAKGCYCSVVLMDPSGARLEHGAAPSLPVGFIASIIASPVNTESSPCAMAAFRDEQVIAPNLRTEARWAAYEWCPMALSYGLQACWSTPISSTAGEVLGAFALYYDEPRRPSPQEQALIDQFTHIASIAVERAQSDAALKRSEARKAAILDSALDCIVTMDHEGRITEFNPAAERTFGCRREQVLGEPLADVMIPPRLREAHSQGLARYLDTTEPHVLGRRVEMTAIRTDGSEFPVELAITRIPLEGAPSFTGYLRDITERKQAEQELRRSESLLAEGQRLSLTGSFSWHVASDDVTFSEQTYRTYEFEPGEPVTLEMIATRFHPEDVPLLQEMIAQARGPGSDLDCEYRLKMPDGTLKHLHLVAHGTRDEGGQLEYIGAIQDVTQRRLSEEALGKAQAELTHVTRVTTLGALTASIAHEVNQPLSGILTNANTSLKMLAVDPPNLDGARETARRTIRDAHRASEVIGRLRALFAKKSLATEAVDLNEATREVIAISWSELQRSRVILRTELADDLPHVPGDRVQLQQVMLNLLRNALDAMSEVDDRPKDLVIRTERDEGDRVRLSVQDVGTGLDAEGADRLFDAFYTTKSGGMGIGLAVSRSIMESHHGRLWVASNEGPGATFSFSIPHISKPVSASPGVSGPRGPAA